MKFELSLGCWLILAIFQETYSRKIYGVDSTDTLLDQETSSLDRNDIEKGNSYCLVLHNVEVNTRISINFLHRIFLNEKKVYLRCIFLEFHYNPLRDERPQLIVFTFYQPVVDQEFILVK